MTSLNPNFAGLLVQYFRQAGLQPGDKVAVAVSGSFPGINIGLYAALETLQLDPVIITSVGASMWGANNPDFTWLDMEKLFYNRDIFKTRSLAATYGGGNDMGRGLSPSGRDLLQAAIDRNGIPLLPSDNIQDAITKRQDFFLAQAQGKSFSAYVNVGGGVASIGSSHNKLLLPAGLSYSLDAHNWPRKGNLIQFADMGVPIIHVLGIADLARNHGLPISPDYQPQPGEGEIFVRTMYRFPLAAAILAVYCLLCMLVLAPEIRHGLFDRLGRKSASPILPVVCLLMTLGWAAFSPTAEAATSRWVAVSPVERQEEVCLNSSGLDFSYSRLDSISPVIYQVNGPRHLKVVGRYLFGENESGRQSFTITALVDGQEVVRKTFAANIHGEVTICDLDGAVSVLRRARLEIGKGKHEISLLATADGSGFVAVRLFQETRRKSSPTVSFQPQQFLELATLQFDSGNQSTYYRFEAGSPLAFSLNGPATVQLFTRLDFDLTMNGTQEYGLEVLRDDVSWRTFQFHTAELSTAHYLERPEVLPGARKKISIDIPRGTHTIEVRCLRPAVCGVTAQIRIPRKALEARP